MKIFEALHTIKSLSSAKNIDFVAIIEEILKNTDKYFLVRTEERRNESIIFSYKKKSFRKIEDMREQLVDEIIDKARTFCEISDNEIKECEKYIKGEITEVSSKNFYANNNYAYFISDNISYHWTLHNIFEETGKQKNKEKQKQISRK